jgi:serine/threonine protein kinase
MLVTGEDCIKLADFGLSWGKNIQMTPEDAGSGAHLLVPNGNNVKDPILVKSSEGTKTFQPPEAFEIDFIQGRPQDIWALGCTLYF